jgi:hypothetical protein
MSPTLTAIVEQMQSWSVPLAVGWAGWMAFGLMLHFWYKYRPRDVVVSAAPVATWDTPAPRARTRSGSSIKPAIPIKTQQPKGDAFGELQALLDSPAAASEPGASHHRPGE